MTRAVILRPRAERDIRSAFDWYESQQRGLGDDFLNSVRQRLEDIGRLPDAFPVIYKNVRRARSFRSFHTLPFTLSNLRVSS